MSKSLSNLLFERARVESFIFEKAEEVVRFDGTERISLEMLRDFIWQRNALNVEIERLTRLEEGSL
jgi:hypothetical protein